ncbi:GMC oxidoreductase [Modestobacter sp. URMC 112]
MAVLFDGREVPDGTVLRADVCIVGSGIAALVLASSLERAGRSVLVLEAGGLHRDRALEETLEGLRSGADHEGLASVSTRRVGGALALWGGRLAPLDPEDFVARPERGESWPLSRTDLDRWYAEAQQCLRAGRYEYRAAAALPGSRPLLPEGAEGALLTEKLWRYSPPVRFRHFAELVATSRRLRLGHHALVTALHQDADGRTARAVVGRGGGPRWSVQASEFVVAGGGLQSTRLLLASRRPEGPALGDEHGQVGRNYITHPVADVARLAVTPDQAARLCAWQRTEDGVYARTFLAVRPEVRAAHGLVNVNLAVWGPDPHDPAHGDGLLSAYALAKRALLVGGLTGKTAGTHRFHTDRPLDLAPHLRNIATTAPGTVRQAVAFGRRRWLADRGVPALLNPGRSGVLRVRLDAEQRPHPGNRVELAAERDALGMPRLRLHYQVREADRDSYYRSLDLVRTELARLGVGRLQLPDREAFLDRAALGSGTHQMGLLRMSERPADGVVDRDCRVHSSPNTYVLSTAVFPTAGAAPPTLTLVALALRLGHHLTRRA